MSSLKVLGCGAVLWDEIEGHMNIGGAVFNQMAHLSMLGAETSILTAVGEDELGNRTLDAIQGSGVDISMVKRVNYPTCVVRVSLGAGGLPTYRIPDFTTWDFVELGQGDVEMIREQRFDYFNFGTIEQRNPVSRASLRTLLEQCTFRHVFLDLNIRRHYYSEEILRYSLDQCDILKLNEEEAGILSAMFGVDRDHRKLMQALHRDFDIELVCITEGSNGASLSTGREFVFCPGYRVEVVDTVGTGDAFSAAFLWKHHKDASLASMGDFACRLGAFVASRQGAVPKYTLDEVSRVLG
jgi:fructokinase